MGYFDFKLTLGRYLRPGFTHVTETRAPWPEHYLPADTQPKAPANMVQVTSRDQLAVGRRYRRYYKPAGKNPQTTPTDQWALDTRVFIFLGHDKGFQADDSPILYTSFFDAGVEPHHGKTGTAWNWCYLIEDPNDVEATPVKEHKMEQYRFSHEELWTLLDPAVQLLKEAENSEDDHGESCLRNTSRSAQTLVLNNQYSRACGDWSSAFNWYQERNPVKDVELYRHAGLAVVVQLKLLGLAWKTIRSVLWQQAQPKTDRYLDRFLMVARYCYDNPELLVKVATQYAAIWTSLVDHLEPRVVDSTWKTYAAIRDIGRHYQEGKNGFTTIRTPPFVPVKMSGTHGGEALKYAPDTVVRVKNDKKHGYSFDGEDQIIAPNLKVSPDAASNYWSYAVPFEVSDKAAEAIQDGTHPLCPPIAERPWPGWTQYEQKGRVTVYAYELTAAQEQKLEEQYGPFVKTPYTGGISTKAGDTSKTIQYNYSVKKSIAPCPPAIEAQVKEILARQVIKNPLDDIVQGQRDLEAKQEELARTGSVTFDSERGELPPPWFGKKTKPSTQKEIEELKYRAFTCGIDTTDSTELGYIAELRAKLLNYLQGQGVLDATHKGDK